MRADRRAHHNELERQRRDILKDLFECLRHGLPRCQSSNRKPSRVEVLRMATAYMQDYKSQVKRLAELEECSAEMEGYVQRLKDLKRHKDKTGYLRLVKEITKKYGRYHNAIHQQASTSAERQDDEEEDDDDDDDDDGSSETESDDESSGSDSYREIVIKREMSDDESEILDVES